MLLKKGSQKFLHLILKQRLNELGVEYTESNFDEMVVEDGFDEPLLDDEI